MLRRFFIKEEGQDRGAEGYAVFSYDEEKDIYGIEIPRTINADHLPAILGILVRQGIYSVEDKWARRFVKERVIPPDRQNIGMILRDVGIGYYDEFKLLEYTRGRCCMDEFYIEEIV